MDEESEVAFAAAVRAPWLDAGIGKVEVHLYKEDQGIGKKMDFTLVCRVWGLGFGV